MEVSQTRPSQGSMECRYRQSTRNAFKLELLSQLGDKKLIVQRASVGAKTMAMANIPAQIQVIDLKLVRVKN